MRSWREAAALLLAVANDASDLLDVAQPLETILDVLLALAIIWLLKEKLTWRTALILLLDALPFIDLVPMWTLYVIYVITKREGDIRKNKYPLSGIG